MHQVKRASMDFAFDVISAQEYERQRALFHPLTQAAIEAVTETLEGPESDGVRTLLRHQETGRPVVWANPAAGVRNAVAPPMVIEHDGNGRWWSEFTLGTAYEGPPGWVHGGICALVLDQMLGEAASDGLTKPKSTGTITLKYLHGTPLGPLRAEAEGVFIQPTWARHAG